MHGARAREHLPDGPLSRPRSSQRAVCAALGLRMAPGVGSRMHAPVHPAGCTGASDERNGAGQRVSIARPAMLPASRCSCARIALGVGIASMRVIVHVACGHADHGGAYRAEGGHNEQA